MAGLQIPLKAGAAGTAVAYDTTVDGSYSVYSAALKDYPVANAFVDTGVTSQEKWGLQVTARATQNNAWKAQLTYGTNSGTGALALNSLTYPFTRTIARLESGNIQTMMYLNGFPTINFDESGNKISTVKNAGGSATSICSGTQNTKGYVTTNTNKFLAVCDGVTLKTYPVDANYVVTSNTPAGTATVPLASFAWVVAAKNQYIWVASTYMSGASAHSTQFKGQLYSISTSGVLSAVGAQVAIFTTPTGPDTGNGTASRLCSTGSYVAANVCHLIMSGVDVAMNNPATQSSGGHLYNTVDLTNVTVFTTTAVKQVSDIGIATDWAGATIGGACLNVGYDGSFGLVATGLGTAATPDIYKVNAAGGFVDSTVNYFDTFLNPCRYRNTTTKMSTITTNTYVAATNTFGVNNNLTTGTFTNLHLNCIWMYDMTGTNAEDDTGSTSFKGVYIPTSALGSSSGSATLKVNGTLALTKAFNHINLTSTHMNWTFSSVLDIATTKINFLAEFANSLGVDCKIGFGLSGGTYASPTGNYELSTINLILS